MNGRSAHRPGLRDARLQLRAASRRRSRAGRRPHTGGLPPRVPGVAQVLAPLPVHDLALPGDENRVLDELRAVERRPRAVVCLDDIPPLEVLDAPVERVEAMDAVWRAVNDLTVDLKMALLLRDARSLVHGDRRLSRDHPCDRQVADLQGARGSPALARTRGASPSASPSTLRTPSKRRSASRPAPSASPRGPSPTRSAYRRAERPRRVRAGRAAVIRRFPR